MIPQELILWAFTLMMLALAISLSLVVDSLDEHVLLNTIYPMEK